MQMFSETICLMILKLSTEGDPGKVGIKYGFLGFGSQTSTFLAKGTYNFELICVPLNKESDINLLRIGCLKIISTEH